MTESAALLSDLCDLISLQVDPATMPESPYLGLEHLEPGRLRATGFGRASDATSQKAAFEPGDVLYGKLRPYLDKAVLADRAGVATTELLVLRPKLGVSPEYLACVVHSPAFVEFAMQGVTGAQHPRTSWAHIRTFELPAHDRSEQSSIAKLLWSLFDLCMAAERGATSASSLKRAAMEQLFTRGLRGEKLKETELGPVPESWDVSTINDVALQTQYGLSIRGQAEGAIPILRMNCQDDGRVRFRDLQYVDLDEATLSAFRLEDGDLLFNRTNSIEHVGRTAIFDGVKEAVFASYLVRLKVDTLRCLPRFLNYYMNRREVQHDIKRLASRAVGQANINATKLRTIAFPLPSSLNEQAEIIEILDALDHKIDLHRRKRDVLDQLFKSLLHKLMTGQISVDDLDLSALPSTHGTAA